MKKLAKLVMLTTMVFFVYSCENSGGQQGKINDNESEQSSYDEIDTKNEKKSEDYFSYQLLETHNGYVKDLELSNYSDYTRSYVIDNGYRFDGLAICYGNAASKDFVEFNDEEMYYNDCIFEWALALRIAEKLYSWNAGGSFFGRDYNYKRVSFDENDPEHTELLYQINPYNEDTTITFYKTYYYDSLWKCWQKQECYAIDKMGNIINSGDTVFRCCYRIADNDEYNHTIIELLNCVHCLPNCIDDNANGEEKEIFKKTYYDLKEAHIYQPDKGYGYRKYPIDKNKYGYDYVELYRIEGGNYKGVPQGTLGIRFRNASSW